MVSCEIGSKQHPGLMLLDCRENKTRKQVVSINLYSEAPGVFSCSRMLDCAPNFPTSSKGLKREVGIHADVVG